MEQQQGVRHFQEELEALKSRLLEMGGLAEERVRASVEGLVSRDVALLDTVLAGDEPINRLHIDASGMIEVVVNDGSRGDRSSRGGGARRLVIRATGVRLAS